MQRIHKLSVSGHETERGCAHPQPLSSFFLRRMRASALPNHQLVRSASRQQVPRLSRRRNGRYVFYAKLGTGTDFSCECIRSACIGCALLLLLCFAIGCRTPDALPAATLSGPGWTIHQGQAVCRPRRSGPEIAGELLLARNQDQRSIVQFSKTPFSSLTAQTTPTQWHIEFPTQHRSF